MDDSFLANYADDNTPYGLCGDLDSVICQLESDSFKLIFNWLMNNALKANPDRSNFLLNSSDTSLKA